MNRAGKIASGLAFCALVGLYLILVFGIQGQIERREEAYAQAESRIATGDYAGGLELLEGMDETYRDVKFLTSYAQAHVFYGQGKLGGAKKALAQCDRLLASSEGAPEGFEDFRSKVSAEYLARVEEERRYAEAYRERVRTGVPFVGMSEADIANTTLGAPSPEERHNTQIRNNRQVVANLYEFYAYGRLILRQHRTDKVVGRRMNFSSDALTNFAGLLVASQEI